MAIRVEAIIPENTTFEPPLNKGDIIRRQQRFTIRNYPPGRDTTVFFMCEPGEEGGAVYMANASFKQFDPRAILSGQLLGPMEVTSKAPITAGPLRLRGVR